MDELQKKHRQEQKDLQSRITQKRKATTKKTRKGINDECADLERQLKEKQEGELSKLSTDNGNDNAVNEDLNIPLSDHRAPNEVEDINESMDALSVTAVIPSPASKSQTKKPSRQKARLARRAAEQESAAEKAQVEAADLPNLRDQELKSMREAYTAKGLNEHEIRSDGHCLYAAIADQLQHSGIGLQPKIEINPIESEKDKAAPSHGYKIIRQVAAAYISQNSDDFVPFLEEPLGEYVRTIEDTGEWGGHLEILALAKAYGVDVNILQGDGTVQKIECGLSDDRPEIWLAYYRHSFGLGEHYNSLRKMD